MTELALYDRGSAPCGYPNTVVVREINKSASYSKRTWY